MRVAIVTHRLLRTDGQGKINYELALRLAERGQTVELVSSELDGPLKGAANTSWHAVPLPGWLPTQLLRNQWFAFGSRRRLRAMRKVGKRPDLIVVNGGITYHRADVNIAMFVHSYWKTVELPEDGAGRGVGSWVQQVYHRFYAWFNAVWEKRAFRRASASVGLAGLVEDQLRRCVGVPTKRVHVIEPGVDGEHFQALTEGEATPLREEMGVAAGERLGIFVGDLGSRRKNLELVLKAMTEVDGVRLAVVGGTTRSVYPGMAESMGLSERVRFLGRRSDVAELVRQADVFCFPSRYDPWALVVTEALASGVPVVVGPEVGASAAVEDGVNGHLLAHAEDLEGMTAALRRVVEDGLSVERRRAVRASVMERTWDRMTDEYEALFDRLLTGGGA
ncbi:MAG: glycosyltransferase family 4 protein [Planctomycetota bacterium]